MLLDLCGMRILKKSPVVDKKGNRIGSGIFYTYMYLLINTFIT